MRRPFSAAALLLISLLAGVMVYRAGTQSFTTVETSTAGLAEATSRVTMGAFGRSEFPLRMPDVAGGILYLTSIFLLFRLLFGESVLLLSGTALATLNPMVLDACSMASGRGLGLGLGTLGTYFVVRWVADGKPVPIGAGVALGLAVAADPRQAFAVIALCAAFFGSVAWSKVRTRDARAVVRFALADALPFSFAIAISAVPFCWREVGTAAADGTLHRFVDSLKAFTAASLLHGPGGLTGAPRGILSRLGWLLLPLLVASLSWAVGRAQSGGREHRATVLFLSSIASTGLLVWIGPHVLGGAWPDARGMTFTWPLIAAGSALLLARGRVATVPVGLALLLFALGFQTHAYYGMESEAATRKALDVIIARHEVDPKDPVLLSAPVAMKPWLDVYRHLRDIDWLAQMPPGDLECHADFYLLPEEHFARLGALGLRTLWRDAVAKTVLAEIGPATRRRLAALREVGFADTPQCNAGVLADTHWVDSAVPGAARYFLRDIADDMKPDRWRWTHQRPAILYHAARQNGLRFKMDFVIHGHFFRGLIPVWLTVSVNGKEIGRRRYDSLEMQTFEASVPPEALRADGIALLETRLDRYYIAPDDGQKLGYLFVRGGFVH